MKVANTNSRTRPKAFASLVTGSAFYVALAQGLCHEVGARARAELAHRAVHVLADSVVRDVQLRCDLGAGCAERHQIEHLTLAVGKRAKRVAVLRRPPEVAPPARQRQADEQHEPLAG